MTKFAVKNPVTILVLAFILLLAGAFSYVRLPREAFPEIKLPLIFATVVYPGASPEDMEKLVAEKIEDKLEGLDGLRKVSSTSGEGYTTISVEFNANVPVETALRRVKDKVDEAKPDLPTDADEPVVQELNFSNIPVLVLSLSADYEGERLDEVAENLKDRLAAMPGVLESKITGKREREIAIDADPAKLRQYGLSLNDLVAAVQSQHRNIPGGTLVAGGNRFSVKLTGEVQSPEKFGDLIVRANGPTLVRLRDVADVAFQYSRDRSTIFRLNGRNSLAITVTKRVGANILDLVDDAKKVVEANRPSWPRGTTVDYTMDQSTDIRHTVNELQNHIILGVILVVVLLSFFLGLRNSLFISTAIPFSMTIGFLVLEVMGVTLNMVVLFSLIIALGMLVDDGIVVVENIYRHLQMGKDRVQAAIDGTREVAIPVTTATITTIVAFLPIIFMPGIMGQFMKYLPITVMVTLAGSLFVAFVFNPVFASLFMNKNESGMSEHGGERFDRFRQWYKKWLNRAVDRPLLVAGFCVFFVISGIVSYGILGPGIVFFPNAEPKVVAAELTGPLGVDITSTDAALQKIEAKLFTMPKDEADVESFSAVTGFGKVAMGAELRPESHRAYVDLAFTEYDKRKVSSWKTMKWMQDSLPKVLPGWKVAVKKQEDGPPQGYPVSFEILGDDFAVLGELTDSVEARLAKVPGLVNINSDYEPVRPELSIEVDREQAQQLGVSTSDVAMAVRGAIQGFEAGKFRVGKDEHDIMVRLDPETRENFTGIDRITVPHKGSQIPLTSLASVRQNASLASIRHLDGNRTVQVWAELTPGTKDESKPKGAALKAVEGIRTPPGYVIQSGSSNREQEEASSFLMMALLVALSLVVLTMVAQFNSVAQPIMVFGGILLSFGGVFWGFTLMNRLFFTEVTFSIIMTGIGIVALAGVVAKNGIVLIDFINHLRREGVPLRDAVVEGGATRLRPVLLTAVTAMIALVPMATGKGFDFSHFRFVWKSESSLWWTPMAWALFWGLFFNTVLTLIAIPTFYYAWEKFKARAVKRFRKQPA
jgi:multidrug efflux pump subunit AcrB